MKKSFSLFLALVMCLSLCACGDGNGTKETNEFDPKKEFRREVNIEVQATCYLSYADVKFTTTTLTDIDVDDDTYTGKGKVTVEDNYGDTYVGKVTAVYKYNAEKESFTKVSLDIETPRKQ